MTFFRDRFGLRAVGLFLLLTTVLRADDPLWNGYGKRDAAGALSANAGMPTVDSTESRYYLLRTGFLMEGTATSEGNHYVIKTDFGTMHVPTVNVEYIGRDKLDIYRYKKSFVDGANCNDLMKFAEWCLSLGLKDEGIAEYELALKAAPNTVLAEVVRERLEAVRRKEEAPEDHVNAPLYGSAAPSTNRNESEVNRWVAGIPKPVVDDYVKKVQPVLLAGCAAADCHGTSSRNQFKIAKPRQLVGTTTHGNLRSALSWINLDYPTESPLLTALVNYHGNAKAPYTVESRQYNNVLQWIQLAAKELPLEYHRHLQNAEQVREPVRINAETSKNEPPRSKTETLLPPGFHDLAPEVKSTETLEIKNDNEPRSAQIDPFDPAVFNARYHGTKLK